MSILHEQLKRVLAAQEREEGIRPSGTAQAEMREFCLQVANAVDVLSGQIVELKAQIPDSPSATMKRIEARLEQLCKPSWLSRLFGRKP